MRIIWRMLAQIQLPTSELPARVAQIRALSEWRVIRTELLLATSYQGREVDLSIPISRAAFRGINSEADRSHRPST